MKTITDIARALKSKVTDTRMHADINEALVAATMGDGTIGGELTSLDRQNIFWKKLTDLAKARLKELR